MKKAYIITTGLILFLVTAVITNAQEVRSPINPNNTIENKIEIIDQMVKDGELNKEIANEIKTQMADCDGNGSKKLGQKYNLQFGKKLGNGQERRNHQN